MLMFLVMAERIGGTNALRLDPNNIVDTELVDDVVYTCRKLYYEFASTRKPGVYPNYDEVLAMLSMYYREYVTFLTQSCQVSELSSIFNDMGTIRVMLTEWFEDFVLDTSTLIFHTLTCHAKTYGIIQFPSCRDRSIQFIIVDTHGKMVPFGASIYTGTYVLPVSDVSGLCNYFFQRNSKNTGFPIGIELHSYFVTK